MREDLKALFNKIKNEPNEIDGVGLFIYDGQQRTFVLVHLMLMKGQQRWINILHR